MTILRFFRGGKRCPTIEDTIVFIQKAHAGQFDKGGEEYWRHPVSVMKRLGPNAPVNYRLAALLHDVLEDTEYTAIDLLDLGYPPEVVNAVALLTKPKGIPYLDAIRRLIDSGNNIAVAVKIADNQDNLDPARVAKLPIELQAKGDKYRQSLLLLQRRTKSRYASDKAVEDFTRVVEQTGILDPVDELAALMSKNDPTEAELNRIGKLLNGQP